MKRLIKITKSAHLTKQLNPLIEKVGNMNYEWINHEIQENCLFIEKKRSLVEFSPKDLDQAVIISFVLLIQSSTFWITLIQWNHHCTSTHKQESNSS